VNPVPPVWVGIQNADETGGAVVLSQDTVRRLHDAEMVVCARLLAQPHSADDTSFPLVILPLSADGFVSPRDQARFSADTVNSRCGVLVAVADARVTCVVCLSQCVQVIAAHQRSCGVLPFRPCVERVCAI